MLGLFFINKSKTMLDGFIETINKSSRKSSKLWVNKRKGCLNRFQKMVI